MVNKSMEEIILNFLVVVGMVVLSASTAMTRVQSPTEIMTVVILTVLMYSALNLGVIKMRQTKMQQDIDELKELLKDKNEN